MSTHLKVRATDEMLERWAAAADTAKKWEKDEGLDFARWVRRSLDRTIDYEAALRPQAAKKRPR